MTENEITGAVVDAAFKVHTALGPGLLESIYHKCLRYELQRRGFRVETSVPVPVIYDGVEIDRALVADLVVEGRVVLELKSVERVEPVHKKQLLTYLRLLDKRVGLLINFNVALIKDGITRVVNGLPESKTEDPT
jgi:GxxExxY protein